MKKISIRLFNAIIYALFLVLHVVAYPITFMQYLFTGKDKIATTLAAFQSEIYIREPYKKKKR